MLKSTKAQIQSLRLQNVATELNSHKMQMFSHVSPLRKFQNRAVSTSLGKHFDQDRRHLYITNLKRLTGPS